MLMHKPQYVRHILYALEYIAKPLNSRTPFCKGTFTMSMKTHASPNFDSIQTVARRSAFPNPAARLRPWLAALLVTLAAGASSSAAVILIDVGNTTGPAGTGWNTISAINATNQSLLDTLGASTGITWTSTGFDGASANTSGDFTGDALAAFGSNINASRDYFFGNTPTNPNPIVTFSGLDTSMTYTFTVFGGRWTIANTRSADYTVTGNGPGTTLYLDASNNTGNVITFSNVTPTSGGTITLSMFRASDNNSNPNYYTYLNAIKIESIPEPTALVLIGGAGAFLVLGRRSRAGFNPIL